VFTSSSRFESAVAEVVVGAAVVVVVDGVAVEVGEAEVAVGAAEVVLVVAGAGWFICPQTITDTSPANTTATTT
jgi:hypothetical protein